jgi:metal-responsive CopG/Arc/MetJ family transcriptional regulator
MMKEK